MFVFLCSRVLNGLCGIIWIPPSIIMEHTQKYQGWQTGILITIGIVVMNYVSGMVSGSELVLSEDLMVIFLKTLIDDIHELNNFDNVETQMLILIFGMSGLHLRNPVSMSRLENLRIWIRIKEMVEE